MERSTAVLIAKAWAKPPSWFAIAAIQDALAILLQRNKS
jgi:hypothetical protein